MKLTKQQIEVIQDLIVEKGQITLVTLKDDLLDHLCCVVEYKMSKGEDFNTALKEAEYELAPQGIEKIQLETIFLLNSNKIIAMKKFMYLIGLLSAMAFVTGWVFKMLHLSGGFELSFFGFLGFAFIFLPLLAINHYKLKIHRALSEKMKLIFGFSSGILVGASVLFKFLHLQGAPILLMLGSALFVLGFLPFLFFTMYKKSVA